MDEYRKVAPVDTLNPIYHYLPYCVCTEIEGKEVVYRYLKTYPPFPWKRDGDPHEGEDPIKFINTCADAGLVRWETKEQELERIKHEEEQGYVRKPVSWEEYQKLTGNRGSGGDTGNDES